MKVCEELKKIRLSKFLSQKTMAKELGVSIATYNAIEKGSTNISLKTIEKISKLTNHTYKYIKEHL